MKLHVRLLAALLFLTAAYAGAAASPTTTDSLLREMHQRYQNDWYSTMKFTQKSTTYNPDGTTKVETWYEAGLLPGKLRIDFGDSADGNGAIYADGKLFIFQKGKLTNTRSELNLLLVLGFDVYRQQPEVTLAQLKQEGIDASKVHEEAWNGEPAYAVGADRGDLLSEQFWIDKKSLLFVRIIEPDRQDPSNLRDIRFLNYRRHPHGLIAERVEVQSKGKITFTEEYSDVQTDISLGPALFDPKSFQAQQSQK